MSGIAKSVGQRIRQRRQELGYSQEYTSEKAGVHPTYIGQVERGEKNATIESIEKICIALDYPMEDLFNKLIVADSQAQIAQKCYDLVITQPLKEQKCLYELLQKMIEYKNE